MMACCSTSDSTDRIPTGPRPREKVAVQALDPLSNPRAQRSRDHRILAALVAEEKLKCARVQLGKATWRQPITRWRAHNEFQQRIDDRDRKSLSIEDLAYLVGWFLDEALGALRTGTGKYTSTRHRLHPEVDAYWYQLVADVAREAAAAAGRPGRLPHGAGWGSSGRLASQRADVLPALVEQLTPAAVRNKMDAERAIVRRVAADPHMLTREFADGSFMVQHRASGLRAQFTLVDSRPGCGPFGSIMSKHYRLPDLDPDPADKPDPELYEGLGIGEKVYLHGAGLAPGVRWAGSAPAVGAHALRRRLHKIDPYIWEGECLICLGYFQDNKEWSDRSQSDFPVH